MSSTPYDRALTPQTVAILQSTSHQFENLFQSSYLSSGSNSPQKPTSTLNYLSKTEIPSLKSALSTPNTISQIFRTQHSSQTIPDFSSLSTHPYSTKNKSLDTLLGKKRKFNGKSNDVLCRTIFDNPSGPKYAIEDG